jgi:hypothetical protein
LFSHQDVSLNLRERVLAESYINITYLSESIKIQNDLKQTIIQEIGNLENHKKFLEEKINNDIFKISKLQEFG